MEKYTISIQSKNSKTVSQIVTNYLKNLKHELLNNPSFLNELDRVLGDLMEKKISSDILPSFEIIVHDDGRSFEIRGGVRTSPLCLNEKLQDNRYFCMYKFHLNENDAMLVTGYKGEAFRFDDFVALEKGSERERYFSQFNSNVTPTVLCTYHSNRGFLKNGIQIEVSTYSETCPLTSKFDDTSMLIEQTMTHSPKEWYYNSLPSVKNHVSLFSATNVHRYYEDLGVAIASYSSNTSAPVTNEYVVLTEYPEYIRCLSTPYRVFRNGDWSISPEYLSYYPDMTPSDLKRKLDIDFLNGVYNSETRVINGEMYSGLKEMVEESVRRKYPDINIDQQHETKNQGFGL